MGKLCSHELITEVHYSAQHQYMVYLQRLQFRSILAAVYGLSVIWLPSCFQQAEELRGGEKENTFSFFSVIDFGSKKQTKKNMAAPRLECRCILVVTHTLCVLREIPVCLVAILNCEAEDERKIGKRNKLSLRQWARNGRDEGEEERRETIGEIIITSLSTIWRLQCKLDGSVRYNKLLL